uniref:Uncharacterized protein n=1 Tax=Timema poppense TaxID=170557 RepID=A0A7R9DBN3_TIMPO|nr:unnamed protein product [Timema poppensis]
MKKQDCCKGSLLSKLKIMCCYGFSNETWNMTLYWWMQYFWITKATFSDAPCHSVLFHEKDIEIERRGVFEEMSLQYLKGAEEPISMSAVSYVMYRRHYLNKPQTLNDKCSNQDSSCYIDDSTLRTDLKAAMEIGKEEIIAVTGWLYFLSFLNLEDAAIISAIGVCERKEFQSKL